MNLPTTGENFMQSQHGTMTDSLADIINILHVGGKSGILTVERDEAAILEEGRIVFVDGKVIEARVGQQSGLTAFNYLDTWKTCRFSFIDHHAQDISMPSQATQNSRSQRNTLPVTPSATYAPYFTTQIPSRINDGEQEYGGGSAGPFTYPFRSYAGEVALQHLERVQISRLQRRLLLLINGQRSLSELARLMVKSPHEIRILLNDLERAGLTATSV
jgi:Domain of unknown function (DUF4388)